MVTGLGNNAEIAEGWVMGAQGSLKSSDILASCCGKCRQQISGFAKGDVKIHSVALNGRISTTTVAAFLPGAFTFEHLLPDARIFKKADTREPSYESVKNRLVREAYLSDNDIVDWLKEIESIDIFSNISQSVVLKLENGAYVAGGKTEDAAFLSINAAQSAVAAAVSEFGDIAAREIFVFTKGRNEMEIPEDSFGALTMSALQTLLQVAAHDEIPLSFFTDDNSVIRTTLMDAAKLAPTCARPFRKKPL